MDENTPTAPSATDAGTQSQEDVSTSQKETDSPITDVETEKKLYAGKYDSPEAMEYAYIEAQSKLTQLAQEKANLERMNQQVPDTANAEAVPELDPTVVPALDNWLGNRFEGMYAQRRENEKAQEFELKHADELKDRLLRATTKDIIQEANAKGERIDQEAALNQAKRELEQRANPKVQEAEEKGFQEGHDLAKAKTQAGAVGTSKAGQKVDPSKLSAAEYAEYYNLPHA